MAKKAPTLMEINQKLARAGRLLDSTASNLRDAKFNPKQNIFRIGSALARIFEIQHEIYRAEPQLLPKYFRGTDLHRKLLSNSRSNGRVKSAAPKRTAKRTRRSPKR